MGWVERVDREGGLRESGLIEWNDAWVERPRVRSILLLLPPVKRLNRVDGVG